MFNTHPRVCDYVLYHCVWFQVIRISSRLHQVTSKEEMPVPLGIGVLSFSSVVVDLSGLVLSPYIVLNTICLPVIWVFGNSLALKILFLELTLSMELWPMVVLTSEFSSLVFSCYSFPRSGLELLGLVFRLWFRPWIRMPVAAAAACFFAASMLQFFSSLYSFLVAARRDFGCSSWVVAYEDSQV